jgi:hypothetical protein
VPERVAPLRRGLLGRPAGGGLRCVEASWHVGASTAPQVDGSTSTSPAMQLLDGIRAVADRVTARLTLVGADPDDDEDLRARKALLILISVLILPVAPFWGALYLAFGSPVGVVPLVDSAFSSVRSLCSRSRALYQLYEPRNYYPDVARRAVVIVRLGAHNRSCPTSSRTRWHAALLERSTIAHGRSNSAFASGKPLPAAVVETTAAVVVGPRAGTSDSRDQHVPLGATPRRSPDRPMPRDRYDRRVLRELPPGLDRTALAVTRSHRARGGHLRWIASRAQGRLSDGACSFVLPRQATLPGTFLCLWTVCRPER